MKTTLNHSGKFRALLCLTGLLALLFATPKARADEPEAGDPPTRVARISFLEGTVSFQPGGQGDWGMAAKNRPVTIGDKIWSDKDSRAELQAGQAAIHLGSMTALSFLNLDENIIQMRLAEGSVNFRVRELREGDVYEVDTPNLAFTVKQAGAFRIDVSENGDSSRVTVIRGEGEVTASGQTYAVHAGERAEFNGLDNVQYSTSPAPEPDGLDRWAADRDLREDNSPSAKYVSRDMPGYSDLDDNGTWSEQPPVQPGEQAPEGPVWYPNDVPVGWAPYSYGYWNWVGPWGWTWVDYAPWGFAPFHYGRWAFIGGRWGWCPGPVFGPPVFGPAFVGFFGGAHFGFGFGFGAGVGWFPLGFGEPFFPWFHCGHGFVERINVRNTFIRNTTIFNTTTVHNFNYVNAHNVNAVTVASHNAFVNGQVINRNSVHLTAASLKNAQVTNGAGLMPNRQSGVGAVNRGNGHIVTPSASIMNRSVVARTAPAAAASHMPVHTMNTANLSAHVNNAPSSSARVNSGLSSRQNQLSQNRPPSANTGLSNRAGVAAGSNGATAQSQAHGSTAGRTWEAQGNATDKGRAPQGFGSSNNASAGARVNRSDRPPWAGTGASGAANGNAHVGTSSYNSNRPSSMSNRSYQPPARSYSAPSQPSRTYSAPSRTYSAPRSNYPAPRSYSAPSRSYSPPSRSYSAPSRSNSAPSHSSGGGGSHGGGGGSPHGGGGGSHGGRH
jgi:hypothetical protein